MNEIGPVLPLLDSLELTYRQLDEQCARLGFTGRHVSYEVLLIAEAPLLSVVASVDSRLAAGRVDEAIRLANLLNATRIRWGAFWVHPERRTLGFEIALPGGTDVSRQTLDLALRAVALDVFWPAFARVAWAGLDAATALEAALAEEAEPPAPPRGDEPPAAGPEVTI